ncbi:Uncharacterised protein [Bordetella pertussis]|nr:Uncharacterised protein [Bordetella pertussis]CFW43273.1 Uncharacterised protein [Bordetella pertussis]CPO75059.1 Uncharacterised protein [Bordetella pertussis]CRE29469.1 Uncharacterised protein [Bordetella pertussis]
MTGAEKPRSSDGTGMSGTCSNVQLARASVSSSSTVSRAGWPFRCSGSARPCASSRPIAKGMWNACLAKSRPARFSTPTGAQRWVSVTVQRPLCAS